MENYSQPAFGPLTLKKKGEHRSTNQKRIHFNYLFLMHNFHNHIIILSWVLEK